MQKCGAGVHFENRYGRVGIGGGTRISPANPETVHTEGVDIGIRELKIIRARFHIRCFDLIIIGCSSSEQATVRVHIHT